MTSTNKQNLILGIIAVALLAGIAWISLRQTNDATGDSAVQLAQTLDPAQFEGKTRDAYQAAADVPEVLAQLPCFCGCMQNSGHKNNLFCFKDSHGAT